MRNLWLTRAIKSIAENRRLIPMMAAAIFCCGSLLPTPHPALALIQDEQAASAEAKTQEEEGKKEEQKQEESESDADASQQESDQQQSSESAQQDQRGRRSAGRGAGRGGRGPGRGATQDGPPSPRQQSARQESPRPQGSPQAAAGNRGRQNARQTFPTSWMDQIEFQSIGPANMSGRIPALAVYEKDPTIWWAASASGGLLKTTNDGFTFEHQFDDQPVVSIGDVQVFSQDSNIVWVGTGEANPRNSVSWGNGIYKSTDGGETWKHLGLDKTFQTGRIALHPTDANIAYVGSLGRLWGDNEDRGVYKTSDGGQTWEKVLFIDSKTGIIDLQMHPTNPEVLIAAAYERQRDGFDGNDPGKKFGPGSAIYRTEDGGKNWQKVSDGLPTCNLGRIGLSWSRSNPDHVFAIVESEKIGGGPEKLPSLGIRSEAADAGVRITSVQDNTDAAKQLESDDLVLQIEGQLIVASSDLQNEIAKKKVGDKVELLVIRDGKKLTMSVELGEAPARRAPRGSEANRPFAASLGGQQENRQGQQGENEFEYGGLYRSDDAGKTWQRINSINPRPMYYSQVRVDPTDENNIYILGTSLYKSSDGGVTFTDDGHGNEVHVDHHSLWIDPRDSRHIILGNDGGIYVTRNRMKNWDHLNHVAIGQFYHVGLDATEDYKVYGGLQDNGSWGGPRRSGYGGVINSDWFRIGGGDGFVCLVDPEDPDQLYSESQNGAMGSYNLRTGQRGGIRPRAPRGTRYRFNWKTPFILSPHNSKIHYSAGNHVFRSLYKGNNVEAISPDITNGQNGAGSAISESAVEQGVLYVGTTDGAVWMTKDGGQNWTAIYSQPEEPAKEESASEEEGQQNTARGNRGGRRGQRQRGDAPNSAADENAAATDKSDKTEESKTESSDAETEMPVETDTDTVAGAWEGSFESSDGQIVGTFEMNLTLGEDNVVTGEIATEEAVTPISNGIFDREQKTLTFTVETPLGEISPTFTWDKSQLSASVALPEDVVLKIDAKRKTIKDVNRVYTGMLQSTQEAKEEPKADKPAEAKSADLVSGKWSGQMIRDGETMSQFSMELKVDANGKVTGKYLTDRGDGEVVDGKYDPANQQVTLPVDTGRMEAVITGKIKDNTLKGEMDFGGGRFVVDIEASRTGAVSSSETKEAAAEDSTSARPLGQWMPGPRWVSSIEASKHQRGRCYISLDGHRSNDDGLYLFVSEDYGQTWSSIRSNLPDTAGSIRVLREDIVNPDVLYLGCEFSAWLSVDRGQSWTKFSNLPTVAVHEFAQHPSNGEIVVGTHGRSLWVFDASIIRQLDQDSLKEDVQLLQPADVTRWRSLPERGSNSTREFATSPSPTQATIAYRLSRPARSVVVTIEDIQGREIFRSEGDTQAGLHLVDWDLRRGAGASNGRRFRGAQVTAGQYRVQLQVNDELYYETLTVKNDPNFDTDDGNGEMDLWSEIEASMDDE